MHRMHIINAILNYKKMQTRGAIFGRERLCIVDRRFYFDGGDFVSIQSLRGEISYQSRGDSVSGETLFCDTGTSNLDPVWYENLSGVVSCPENSNINTNGLDSVVIGSRDK